MTVDLYASGRKLGDADFVSTLSRFASDERALTCAFALWVAYSASIFLRSDGLVPDEMLFLAHAQSISIVDAYSSQPKYGYGSFYWAIMSMLGTAAAARLAALILMIAVPAFILWTAADAEKRLLALLLWLSCPVAFWGGKLIGPEIWTLALCSAAIAAFHFRLFWIAGVLCGLATGVKVISLPIVAIVGLMISLSADVTIRRVVAFSLAVVAGLLAAYPLIAIYPPSAGPSKPFDLLVLWNIFLLHRWEWDAVFSGGFLHFFMAAPVFLAVLMIGLVRAPRLALPVVAGTLVLVIMMIKGGQQYGWYGFSLIPPALYLAVQALTPRVLVAAIAMNALIQVPVIAAMVQQKVDQHRALSDPQAVSCMQSYLDRTKKTKILDMAEFGMPLVWPASIERVRYWGNPTPETVSTDAIMVMTRMLVADNSARAIYDGYLVAAACPYGMILERP